jgi:hypothetical protein
MKGGMMFNRSIFEKLMNTDILCKDLLTPIDDSVSSIRAFQNYWVGLSNYVGEFLLPFLSASSYFKRAEQKQIITKLPVENFMSHLDLLLDPTYFPT